MPLSKEPSCVIDLQLASEIWDPLEISPLNPIVEKSCNIECCSNKMHLIVANVIVSKNDMSTKSIEKDNYVRFASFILDMGPKGF